jgi:hypothetical protein
VFGSRGLRHVYLMSLLLGGSGNDKLQNGLYGLTRARIVRSGSGRDRLDFASTGQLRAPRRGDVIDVSSVVVTERGGQAEHVPVIGESYDARWRVVV